jgi:hypothetical protein
MRSSIDKPPSDATQDAPVRSRARIDGLPLILALLFVQLPLILNPGYFSHDDLQWLARADVPAWGDLPWIAWLDVTPLQYRPLTFNVWLVLAHALGRSPQLMHLAFVMLGTANAWLLARVLVAAGASARIAAVAALVFALSPTVVYVHGWTGTLADLLTLGLGLLAARILQNAVSGQSHARFAPSIAACALLTAMALLCKESAIVLPALLPLVLVQRASLRTTTIAIAPAATIAILYLALRLPILAASADIDPTYAWSFVHIPARLTEYLLFPYMPPLFEIAPLLAKSPARIIVASLCMLALLASLATAGRRWPLIWLTAFIVALAPVLVLPIAYNQYAYLASAVAVGICAMAWARLRTLARSSLAVLAGIAIVHGAIVMTRMHSIGEIQRNLYADLTRAVAESPVSLFITTSDPRDAWLPGRLLRDVGTYRGVALAGRVHFGDPASAPASDRLLWMNRDGHLHPDGSPLTPD